MRRWHRGRAGRSICQKHLPALRKQAKKSPDTSCGARSRRRVGTRRGIWSLTWQPKRRSRQRQLRRQQPWRRRKQERQASRQPRQEPRERKQQASPQEPVPRQELVQEQLLPSCRRRTGQQQRSKRPERRNSSFQVSSWTNGILLNGHHVRLLQRSGWPAARTKKRARAVFDANSKL